MGDWSASGGIKIERAKTNIAEFESATRSFLEAHPYSAVSQFDSHLGEITFVVRVGHAIPTPLAAIASDAIHNLRALLDILWRQVWGAPTQRKQYFPLFENARELETRFERVKQGPQKTAVSLLRAIKPYKSGNPLLWALNEIETGDKHEMPILAAATYKKVIMLLPPDVAVDGKTGVRIVSELASGYIFLEYGTELPIALTVATDAGPVVDMKCELTADIAFGKGEVLEGEPVVATLHQFADLVDGIAQQFIAAGLLR